MSALLINEKYQASLGQKTHDYRELIGLIDWANALYVPDNVYDDRKRMASKRASLGVQIGSFSSSNQIVLSGSRAGVLAACGYLNELEIANRAADLPCSENESERERDFMGVERSPFHSHFMSPAAEGMKLGVNAVRFAVPARS
ncbi:hypothetical protein PGT21_024905 [Puccinia graminis f. sp. tritici]|uniref:Uncharacterized protein n=1 Tax=Puccinia graminis f. sp. tritici TaxID=56615 RepID=A0A5B0MLH4_PUCGR|nr:hypothetical protein PGT21_024905 [Puccinia graminis f. sp. tritici]